MLFLLDLLDFGQISSVQKDTFVPNNEETRRLGNMVSHVVALNPVAYH